MWHMRHFQSPSVRCQNPGNLGPWNLTPWKVSKTNKNVRPVNTDGRSQQIWWRAGKNSRKVVYCLQRVLPNVDLIFRFCAGFFPFTFLWWGDRCHGSDQRPQGIVGICEPCKNATFEWLVLTRRMCRQNVAQLPIKFRQHFSRKNYFIILLSMFDLWL